MYYTDMGDKPVDYVGITYPPKRNNIYNFSRPFLRYHYYILNLTDICLGVEMIFKDYREIIPLVSSSLEI